jgi:hypothetical protein
LTITVGRLLAVTGALIALIIMLVFVWQRQAAGHGGSSAFASRASAICREQLSAIKSAPDFQTALSHSREMRASISALTPPLAERATFADWIAQMKTTEDAMLHGDMTGAQEADNRAQQDAQQLGLADACITTRN